MVPRVGAPPGLSCDVLEVGSNTYVVMCVYIDMCVYIYICMQRERERERERDTYIYIYIYIYTYIYIYILYCVHGSIVGHIMD